MASHNDRQRPRYISTIDIDVDDIRASPNQQYRQEDSSEESKSFNSIKVKKRWCLITLILILVIITLLTIAALVIAIYSLALATKNSAIIITPAATYSTTTANVSAAICSPSPTTTFTYSTTTPTQCVNYTINTDATRNIDYTSSINYCDNVSPFNNTTSTWIRFEDPAGTLVANAPVPSNYCGTVATGWYAGQYPATIYSTATSIVCFYYSTNTCYSCNLISVTNCQTFYVFLLPQTQFCNYRYCTL